MSRLEALVVRTAARCGVDELVLASMAIVVLCVGAVGIAYGVGLIG
jgi:hypothetical protein